MKKNQHAQPESCISGATGSEVGPRGAITSLLEAWTDGSKEAYDHLFELVYHELHHIATHVLKGENDGVFQPTSLIHETYLRLVQSSNMKFSNRLSFYAFASKVMRRIMVDNARARLAAKRDGEADWLARESSPLNLAVHGQDPEQLLALDLTLERMKTVHTRKSQLLEMRYFGGLESSVLSAYFNISERTVRRELKAAKQWISYELGRN